MKVKEESEKVGLKLNIQKTKIMASGSITSWQTDRETVETVAEFIFRGSKITADGDCGHEIKRRLLLGRKVMTNLDSILKSRYITLPTKVHLVKAMVFPVVMYGCESWALKNWCFWTVVLEKTLESPLNYEEIHPVHPKGGQSWVFMWSTDVEAETPTHWPPDAKTLMLGKIEAGGEGGDRGWDCWMASPTRWTWVWVDSGVGDGQGGLVCCGSWGHKESDSTEWLNWAELN